MTVRLASGPEHEEFARTVSGVCADHYRAEGEHHDRAFDVGLWRRLGDAGVWSVAASGGGTVADAVVAVEALGAEGIAGPVVPTFAVLELLDDSDRAVIETGEGLAALADEGLVVPWGVDAQVLFLLSTERSEAAPARFTGVTETVGTLGMERWARGEVEATGPTVDATRALAVANVTAAGYAVGAAGRILEMTVEYTMDRRQFGKPIFSFQTVAHRLADAAAHVDTAGDLTATAARLLGPARHAAPTPTVQAFAASARLFAVDVALRTGFLGHQLAGGMGFVAGSLLSTLSRRVQQLAHVAPCRDSVVHSSTAFLGLG